MSVADAKTRLAIKSILFATDFSEVSQNALPFVVAFARRYQSKVVITNVIEEVPVTSVPLDSMPPEIERERELAQKRMQEFLKPGPFAELATEVVIEPGFVWPVLANAVLERNIDLMVLGTHGRSAVGRLLLGSVAEEICRHAPCPVVTIGPHVKVPAGATGSFEKILFATDFSDGSLHALHYALAFAEEHDARLIILHVIQPPSLPINLSDELVAEYDKKLRGLIAPEDVPGKRPIFTTLVGAPADQMLALAAREKVGLIVIGMHQAGAFASHWPFEVSAQILARAQCPVLSVRQ